MCVFAPSIPLAVGLGKGILQQFSFRPDQNIDVCGLVIPNEFPAQADHRLIDRQSLALAQLLETMKDGDSLSLKDQTVAGAS